MEPHDTAREITTSRAACDAATAHDAENRTALARAAWGSVRTLIDLAASTNDKKLHTAAMDHAELLSEAGLSFWDKSLVLSELGAKLTDRALLREKARKRAAEEKAEKERPRAMDPMPSPRAFLLGKRTVNRRFGDPGSLAGLLTRAICLIPRVDEADRFAAVDRIVVLMHDIFANEDVPVSLPELLGAALVLPSLADAFVPKSEGAEWRRQRDDVQRLVDRATEILDRIDGEHEGETGNGRVLGG